MNSHKVVEKAICVEEFSTSLNSVLWGGVKLIFCCCIFFFFCRSFVLLLALGGRGVKGELPTYTWVPGILERAF